MILIDIKYIQESDIVSKYRDDHIKYLDEFYKGGNILASGPCDDYTGGFIISTMSRHQAEDYVTADPFYLNNIGEFTIKDFTPTKSSSEFKLLINTSQYSEDGRVLFDQLHGKHAGEQLITALDKVSPDFSRLTFDFAFGEIFARNNGIPMITKELITIATFCAIGDSNAQFKSHYEAAINLGASKHMVIETLLLIIPFVGFARVANTLLSLNLD